MKKRKSPPVPLAEQIANVLNVCRRMRGKFVVQTQKKGEWNEHCNCNPLMSDGGIQPPGPPLYGPLIFASREDAERQAAGRIAKFKPAESDGYAAVEKEGKWYVAQWLCESWHPFSEGKSEAAAREETDLYNRDKRQLVLRVVPIEEDLLAATCYPRTADEIAEFGKHPAVWEVIKKRPGIVGADPTNDAHLAPMWVANLPDDEPVDVALDTSRSGTSDDCFLTTAGELYAAGYGQLHFERNASGVTVYVDTRAQWARIAAACE